MQTVTTPLTRRRKKATSPKTFSRPHTKTRARTAASHASSKTFNKGRYVTIYLSHTLATRYEDQAALFKTTVGKLIKERVEENQLSFYDKMKKFIGTADGLPSDLSTNPAYLENYGKDSIPKTKCSTSVKK